MIRHEADAPGGESRLSYGALITFAVPIALANLTEPLVGLVDAFVIGRSAVAEPLAAVAMGGAAVGVIFISFNFLRLSVTGDIARAVGGDQDGGDAGAALIRGLVAALLVGLTLLALRPLITAGVLAFYPAEDAVENLAGPYIRIRLLSAPFTLLNFAILGALIGFGASGRALMHQGALNLMNAFANAVFVWVFALGVQGVAWGGVVAQAAAIPLGLYFLKDRLGRLRAGGAARAALTDGPAWRRFVRMNTDLFLRTLALLGSFLIFSRQSATLGPAVQAANQVLLSMVSLAASALDGFASAAEAEAGRAVGARRPTDFRLAVMRTTILAACLAASITALYAIVGGAFLGVVTNSEAVVAAARHALPWAAAAPIVAVWAYQLDGIFVGAGASRPMRDAMLLSAGAFTLVVSTAPRFFHLDGLWAALMTLFLVRAATLGAAYPKLVRGLRTQAAAPTASTKR